jgi:hypothetical protein
MVFRFFFPCVDSVCVCIAARAEARRRGVMIASHFPRNIYKSESLKLAWTEESPQTRRKHLAADKECQK